MAAGKAIQVPQPGLPCLHGQREPCRLWNPASESRSMELSYGNNGSGIKEIKKIWLPGRRWGVLPLHPLKSHQGNRRHTHRRSWSSCCRWFPHGSAYGTKSSDLRACQALLGYLVLPGAIRLAFHSGIHPHLPQRRRDASSLPSPVAAGAVGCKASVTRSAFALGVAHTRLSAMPQ